MEANNHFNYGTQPTASTNSGLKRSSGDSLYTNGSSMSFSQQGKNMNGEMNVNGVTTVLGSSVPGSHPPTTPYPHMSNHQSSMGYDYLWGGQAQYSSAMGPSPGHGMHQKQPPSGMMQPQSQHHYQGHGQYQLNGGMGSSHQPTVAGSPNMSSPGGQYWSRSNPGPQQMGFNSPSVYGSYQSHVHPGLSSSQHHQQQQSLQSPAHQPSQQHLHPQHHPQHHHQQQQQQSQHYSMMPNGMPYYQPHHPTLPSPQPQPTAPSQPQSQSPMIPPAPQNFTPPRGSPQHHNIGRGGTSSPLPVSSVSMLSPSSAQDSGSPQGQGRERSPHPANVGRPAVMQGNMSETYQEADEGYKLMDEARGGHRLPRSDGFQPKPPLPHEYSQHAEQSAAQCTDISKRDQAVNASPRSMSSHPSGSPAAISTSPLGKASTPPRLSMAPVVSSVSTPGPATDPSHAVVSTPPRVATPPSLASLHSVAGSPRLSSPPLMVQGLRPPSGCGSQIDSAGSPHRTMGSPSRAPALPSKLPALPPLLDNAPRLPVFSSTPLVTAPAFGSNSDGRKMLFPRMTSSPYTTSHTTATALAPSYAGSAPISALQQMVDGSRSHPVTSRFPDPSQAPPEASGPLTKNSISPAQPKPRSSVSTPPRLVPAFPSTDDKSVPTLQLQKSSSPAAQHALTTAPASTVSPAPVDADRLAPSVHGPASQPLYSLPPSTTQASRTTFVSAPPPLVSSTTSAAAASPLAPASAVTKASCVNVPSPQAPEPPPPKTEEEDGDGRDGIGARNGGAADEGPCVDASPSEDESMLHSTSGVDLSSSGMEDTSRMDGDGSHVNESTRMDDSSFVAEETSGFDRTSHTDEDPSGVADSTLDSHGSSSEEGEEFDDSRAEETSQAEETMASGVSTGDATLDSSLNSTAPLEESNVDSLQLSNVDSSQINTSVADSTAPLHTSTQESEDDLAGACDLPDSAGPIGDKATVNEATPGPASKITEEEIMALKETPTSPRVPPLTIKTSPASGRPVKTPGKPRKPRTPKASTPAATPAEKAPRKPRARTPKVEKIKKPKAAEAKAEEGGKVKGAPRKRKKPLKEEAKEASDVSQAAGPPAGEVDPISAIIEAVLARASEASSADENLKKNPKKARKQGQEGSAAKVPKLQADAAEEEGENDADDSSTAGESNRRRVATEEQVQFPLLHGWRREIRVKKTESRMKGETWYYTPCGRRMKQFPEIIKYLKRHQDSVVSREHFSFSPRMPIGDFYEERESPEGKTWVLLANEEVPSIIMAITGRRGRPPNPDKEKPRRVRAPKGGQVRRPGRPPKPKMVDLLSKVDAKLLKRLEAKEAITEEDKEKIAKIKKKMKRKARMKRKEDNKNKKIREEKKKAKLEKDQVVSDQAVTAEPTKGVAPPPVAAAADPTQAAEAPQEPKKARKKRTRAVAPAPVQQTDEERIAQGKRVLGARSKAKALAKAQAEAEAAAQAALTAKRAAERRAAAQRRLEERKRQQTISDELKKPTEDMCLTDHKPLPELSRIPGVVLSGAAFAHCLTVVEFLHGYGKVIGLNIPKDIPSLATLQEGLLGLGEGQGEVQDLMLKLLEAALHDPGLSSYYQSVKILGDKLADLELTRSTASEPLRLFLESHGYDLEVCDTLRTKTFHALPPDTKASILGFLVEELNGSNVVISDIDNTLENMATYRKNKWIIEGKLRKLKAALARRTGRPEEDLGLEERRRSTRVAEEEGAEESSLLQDRASRRGRKEEPKLSDSESPTNASIPELERQIDKLTKRQQLFRKKLLQSSHSMRAVSLGQDRFRRRYLALPHLGAILVEGPEELLSSEDSEVLVSEVPVTLLKREPKVEETPTPTSPPASPTTAAAAATAAAKPPTSSPDVTLDSDGLPGTASLMSQPRGRGRPRKIKPEVELHLRTAKIRRRRRSSARSGGEDGPGSPSGAGRDLTHTAFKSWLTETQEPGANANGTATGDAPGGQRPEDSVKETAEKRGQWFNLLPKEPCDSSSLTAPQGPVSPSTPRVPLSTLPAELAASLLQSESALPGHGPTEAAQTTPQGGPTAPLAASAADPATTPPALDPNPAPTATPAAPATPSRPVRRRRRGSRGSSPARRGARSAAAKRRGRPPNAVFQELEQQYFTQMVVKPIPTSMVRGWWVIRDAEELQATLRALNPRGIREKVLHKHLAKHMENLGQMCTKAVADPIFQVKTEEDGALMKALQQPWRVQERMLQVDINGLQWVEELEQRVITADLHLKVAPQSVVKTESSEVVDPDAPVAEFQAYTAPEPDSTRDDLQYYEHEVDPRDDWTVRTKKEWSDLPRVATHALDLAVLRLANLERNIERRYLKEPLWNTAEVMRLAPVTTTPGEAPPMDVMSLESEITPRLRTWRQALDRCRSAPQLCLCILQLEKAIAWERSVVKLNCQVCRKGDNDEYLLLCDGCDRGCHMYCLRPKVTQVPEGDWFCPTCTAKEDGASPGAQRSAKKRTRLKKRRYEDDSSDEETAPRRLVGMATRHKDTPPSAPSSSSTSSSAAASRYCGGGGGDGAGAAAGISPAKRRRMTTRNQPDLTYCEIILMEMEAHASAWPFLEPVNPRLVPGYRRIVKTPMDFLTMRERLLQGGYCNCEEFAADAQLVFNNCQLFNEDTSEVGLAGHAMRVFFENRWAEFYDNKDK